MQRLGEILSVAYISKAKVAIQVIDDENRSIHSFVMTEPQLDEMISLSKYGKWFLMQGGDPTGFPVIYDTTTATVQPNEEF